jgi:predicted aspartyl protease
MKPNMRTALSGIRFATTPALALLRACLILLGLVAQFDRCAIAQTRPEDLPPPPGALERELTPGLQVPADGPGSPSTGTASVLSGPIEIPFILEGGHIIIEASIGGGPVRPFLFDTGARHTISPEVARTLNAPVIRTSRAGGIGSKISQVEWINAGSIALGGATLQQQTVGVLDMPNVMLDRGSRPRLAGLIGSELLAHYVVTIDYTRRTLTLNSHGFRPQSAAFSLPLGLAVSMDGLSHPSISAELDGITGQFVIDTGASAQVMVSERFQQDHPPFSGTGAILHYLSPGGLGGHANLRIGFGRQFRIGPFALPSPLVAAIDHGNSVMGSLSRMAGLIDNGVLANFILTIDLAAARAYFEPVPDRVHATTLFGTGMILDKPDHDTFEVLDVLQDTAADRAGLRRGDHVVAIGDRAARDLGLSDVHVFAPKSVPALTVLTADHRRLDLGYSHRWARRVRAFADATLALRRCLGSLFRCE